MSYRSSIENRSRASSLAIVVGLHGAAIAAALLAKSTILVAPPSQIPHVVNIAPPIDPPPLPPPPPSQTESPPMVTDLPIHRPPIRDTIELPPIRDLVFADPGPPLPPPPPIRDVPAPPPPPVLTDARFAASSLGRLQPPYPGQLLRSGKEGEVTVRVTVGADGRVKRVDKIRADDDAFFEATQRYAMRAWRFEPATRDGRPIESSQVHTVRFEIRG